VSPTYLTHWLHKEIGKTFTALVLERRTAEDVLAVVESDVQPDFILLPKTDSVLTGQKGRHWWFAYLMNVCRLERVTRLLEEEKTATGLTWRRGRQRRLVLSLSPQPRMNIVEP
jgi:hypothetical protein